MSEILLCSHNPILIKSLYGVLRDEGYAVEVADHPALAVQMFMNRQYSSIIFDSEPFGLSAEEAVQIIRSMAPEIPVIVAGSGATTVDAVTIKAPVDIEEFRQVLQSVHHARGITIN